MSDQPIRVQLSRRKGCRMPENTLKVDRGTMWGNFAAWRHHERKGQVAVDIFRDWVENEACAAWKGAAVIELRGKNLACWCHLCDAHKTGKPFDIICPDCEPCHVDVLGPLANVLDHPGNSPAIRGE